MNLHRSIFMVEAKFRPGAYVAHSRPAFDRIARDLIFEGVDGDEENNTVTYWYRNRTDNDEG